MLTPVRRRSFKTLAGPRDKSPSNGLLAAGPTPSKAPSRRRPRWAVGSPLRLWKRPWGKALDGPMGLYGPRRELHGLPGRTDGPGGSSEITSSDVGANEWRPFSLVARPRLPSCDASHRTDCDVHVQVWDFASSRWLFWLDCSWSMRRKCFNSVSMKYPGTIPKPWSDASFPATGSALACGAGLRPTGAAAARGHPPC